MVVKALEILQPSDYHEALYLLTSFAVERNY
jgi:hypothetical protein